MNMIKMIRKGKRYQNTNRINCDKDNSDIVRAESTG